MNHIKYIQPSEIQYINFSNSFVAEIDGKTIQSENDWLYTMAEKFHFPVYDGQKNISWKICKIPLISGKMTLKNT